MNRSMKWTAIALTCLGIVGGACANSETVRPASPDPLASASAVPDVSSAAVAPIAPPTDTAPPPSAVAAATPAEPPAERMGAPLVLQIKGPESPPDKGDLTFDIEIDAREAIKSPVTLTVVVPSGATLTKGQANESLQFPQPQKVSRTIVVKLSGKLSGPIVVTAESKDPNNAFGLTARKEYPKLSAAASSPPSKKPPSARPPSAPPGGKRP